MMKLKKFVYYMEALDKHMQNISNTNEVLEKVLFKPHQGISHAEQLRIYMCHGIKELRSLIV